MVEMIMALPALEALHLGVADNRPRSWCGRGSAFEPAPAHHQSGLIPMMRRGSSLIFFFASVHEPFFFLVVCSPFKRNENRFLILCLCILFEGSQSIPFEHF
jgi:hypothetical protein